jgi:hypothetical protein
VSPRAASRLGLSLCAFSVALVPVMLTFVILSLGVRLPPGAQGPDTPLFLAPMVLAWASVGAVVVSRRPGNPIGWLFCGVGIGLAVTGASYAYALYALYGVAEGLPMGTTAAWLSSWLFIISVFVGPVFLFYLFPDGRFLSRGWRIFALLLLGVAAVSIASDTLRPDMFRDSFPGFTNPVGVGGAAGSVLGALDDAGQTFVGPSVTLGAAAAMTARFRSAGGSERQQLKWVAYVATLTGLAVPAALISGHGPLAFIAFSLVLAGLFAIPVAAGVAILRYRLYDIDAVINRTLVYGALTATLAVIYIGSVLLLQLLLSGLTQDSGLAVAASTLAVAAVFRPARSWIQQAVDRRFYRRKYDAARTLERFGARLRDEVDLDALGSELRGVVTETMQPASVSLWLRAREVPR